jgi:hypothetical protein
MPYEMLTVGQLLPKNKEFKELVPTKQVGAKIHTDE